MSDPGPSLVVGGSDDEPLVFAGPPGELTGRIRLHNPGDANVVLRDAGLKDPSGALRLPSARQKLAPVVLRPDQGGEVPLSIAVDPATPPGEHSAELDLGGRTRAVVLLVAESLDLSVLPASLVVVNAPGVEQRKRLVVANEGNVAFALGDPGAVPLQDDMLRGRVKRLVIEGLLEHEKPDLEALLVALLAVVREEDDRLGHLEVRLAGGKVELRPGETKAVELAITLAGELPAGGRYRGRVPILTRDVDVVVPGSGGPVHEEAAPAPARRRGAGAGRAAPRGAGPAKRTRRGGSTR